MQELNGDFLCPVYLFHKNIFHAINALSQLIRFHVAEETRIQSSIPFLYQREIFMCLLDHFSYHSVKSTDSPLVSIKQSNDQTFRGWGMQTIAHFAQINA